MRLPDLRPAGTARFANLTARGHGLGVLAALLLAALALAVLSVQAVRREAVVRSRLITDTHRGIADLVNARLDGAMAEADRAIAADLQASDLQAEALLKKLHEIETSRPWLQPLVLVSRGRLRSELSSGVEAPSGVRLKPATTDAEAANGFRGLLGAAEQEEHRLRRPDRAALLYANASAQAANAGERTDALNGQARAELKAGWPARALETYKKLIAAAWTLDTEQARRALIARDQIVVCSRLLGGGSPYAGATLDLYEFLLAHRFILDDDTYDFYRQRIDEALATAAPDVESGQGPLLARLRAREQQVNSLAVSVHALWNDARPRSGLSGDKDDDQGAVRYFATEDDRDPVVAVTVIRSPGAKAGQADALVAHPWGASNVTALVERLLSERGPWSEVGIALVGSSTPPAFSSIAPVPADAARATVALAQAPLWRVAAFPKSGSLDALVVRDVTRYAGFLVLVFGTVVAALLLAARSVSRELALSRLRSDFVASVSHDLKTPLSSIRMFAESLRAGWVPDDKRADYYEVITRESERLTGLINNVLDFSRIESGTRKYQLARTDLREVLADLLDRYRFHLKATNIELAEELPPDPVYADVEREAIEQVLLNLLSNAMKYMGDIDKQPRQVRVSLGGSSGRVTIGVADTGIGMSDEQCAHIFERFYRGDDDRVRAVAGSGLGLTLVKHIVDAHDGTITVESVPNQGSTFAITLPLAGAEP